MKSLRRHTPVLIIAVVLVGALTGPAAAAKTFGQRFDNQVKQKLTAPGIINSPGNPVHWTQLKGVPAVFADGADDGLTNINDCPDGSAIQIIHEDATVECVSIAAGDITGVTAGEGLMGGGETDTVELGIDPTLTQARVDGTCTAGESITAIEEDGNVICESGGPIAAGRILSTGLSGAAGTNNWTSELVGSHYEITITDVAYNFNNHAAFITPMTCDDGVETVTYKAEGIPAKGKVNVFFYDAADQVAAACMFQFQVIAY